MVSITRSKFVFSEPLIELGSKKGRNSALELMVSGKAYIIFDDEEDDEQEKQDEHSREFYDFHSTAESLLPAQRRKKSKPNFTVRIGT